jgi:hypothetical protein
MERNVMLFSVLVVFLGGCGDDDGGGESCAAFQACGGDPTGRWEIVSACGVGLEAESSMQFGDPACDSAVRKVKPHASGTYVFTADGQGMSDVTVSLDTDVLFTNECIGAMAGGGVVEPPELRAQCADWNVIYSEDPTYATAACNVVGTGCECVLASAEEHLVETHMVEGTNINDGMNLMPFCVQGDTLLVQDGPSDNFVLVTFKRVVP